MFVSWIASTDDAEDGALERIRRRTDGTPVRDSDDAFGVRGKPTVVRRAHLRQQLSDLRQTRPGLVRGQDGSFEVAAAKAVKNDWPNGNSVHEAILKG